MIPKIGAQTDLAASCKINSADRRFRKCVWAVSYSKLRPKIGPGPAPHQTNHRRSSAVHNGRGQGGRACSSPWECTGTTVDAGTVRRSRSRRLPPSGRWVPRAQSSPPRPRTREPSPPTRQLASTPLPTSPISSGLPNRRHRPLFDRSVRACGAHTRAYPSTGVRCRSGNSLTGTAAGVKVGGDLID